jgi:tetratricopeptide (TPR) repeat protein
LVVICSSEKSVLSLFFTSTFLGEGQIDPEYIWVVNQKGVVYLDWEKYEEALEQFDLALQIDPEYKSAYANKGHAYRIMKQYENAISAPSHNGVNWNSAYAKHKDGDGYSNNLYS